MHDKSNQSQLPVRQILPIQILPMPVALARPTDTAPNVSWLEPMADPKKVRFKSGS
jgi:hypothetical protein